MLALKALPAPMGAEVTGVNMAESLDEDTARALVHGLYERQILVIRGQRLTPEELVRFSHCFGSPHPHALDYRRLPGYPAILPLSNIFKDGKPIHAYDGSTAWHVDQAYDAEPASATMLYCINSPDSGGETHIADMFGAYDSLSADMKKRIESLEVVHRYGDRGADVASVSAGAADDYSRFRSDLREELPEVRHPLVRRHPVTGRKSLFAVSGSSRRIVDMPVDTGVALLNDLTVHAVQPQFVYSHSYQVDDVVIWDNAATMHAAARIPPAKTQSDVRLMHRISVKGYRYR